MYQEAPLLWTIDQVCAQTGLGATKVRSLINEGNLEAVRIGKAVRVPADSLEDFIDRLRSRNEGQ